MICVHPQEKKSKVYAVKHHNGCFHSNKQPCCLLQGVLSNAEGLITLSNFAFPGFLFFDVFQGVAITLLKSLILLTAVTGHLSCYQLQQALHNQPHNSCNPDITVMLPADLLCSPLPLFIALLSSRQYQLMLMPKADVTMQYTQSGSNRCKLARTPCG